MEYYLCRAYEVARLNGDEILKLQEHEKKERIFEDFDERTQTFGMARDKAIRCLMPFEIQEMFNLQPLKDCYGIPDDQNEQAKHNQRIREELKKAQIAPKYDISPLNVSETHSFDSKILDAVKACTVNFHYVGGRKFKRATEEVE